MPGGRLTMGDPSLPFRNGVWLIGTALPRSVRINRLTFLHFPSALGSRHLRSGAEAVFRTWPRFGAELCHREVWQPAPQWVGNLVVGEIPAGREVPPFPPKNSQSFSRSPASLLFRSALALARTRVSERRGAGRLPAVISKIS